MNPPPAPTWALPDPSRLHAAARARHDMVDFTVTVDLGDAARLRYALHQRLRDNVGFYVVAIDHSEKCATVRLHVGREHIDAIMGAVIEALPHATLGKITTLAATREFGRA